MYYFIAMLIFLFSAIYALMNLSNEMMVMFALFFFGFSFVIIGVEAKIKK